MILYTPDGTLKLYEPSAVTNEFAVYPPSFTMEVMTPNSFCAMTDAPIAGNPVGPITLPSTVPEINGRLRCRGK